MTDVLIIHNPKMLPMEITNNHLNQIQSCITGRVYYCTSEEEALEKAIDADVLFIWGGHGKMPEKYCSQSSKLKWIHCFSAGVDGMVKSSLAELPVIKTNARGFHGITIGLTVLGYIISHLRRFPLLYKMQQQHTWTRFTEPAGEPGGMTVGIIGAGSIALEVARLCKTVGMYCIGVKRNPCALKNFDEVYGVDKTYDILSRSDFVVILTPLTDDTYHMIDNKAFEVMKSTGVLINVARGAIVNTEDLIYALENKKIAGAYLDVTEPEPLNPDSKLWDLDNVIITPHSSGHSKKYMDRAIIQFCESLKLFDVGKEPLNKI